MTENKIVDKDRDKQNKSDLKKDMENNENRQQQLQQHESATQKDQQSKTEQHDSRFRRLSQFLDFLNIPRHHSGHSGSSSSSNNSQQHSPQTPHAATELTTAERRISNSSNHNNNSTSHDDGIIDLEHLQNHLQHPTTAKRSSCVSSKSEILMFDFVNGEISDLSESRFRRLSQFLDFLNIPRHHSGHSGSSSSSNNSQQHSPQTPHAATELTTAERRISNSSNHNNNSTSHDDGIIDLEHLQNHLQHPTTAKRSSCVSSKSEILMFDFVNGEISDLSERSQTFKDDCGTQRVYRKTSANCVLTMYLPSRKIILSGNSSSTMTGIVFADPKVIQDYRIYAQLTLTFRYGREDEEVMGLRFCNEAIMCLCQIWPRKNEPNKPIVSPLQEALLKRLGDGALPFTLTLTAQAPPSVQLVPAKSYYGAPIGTSYDVRCFIANKADEKFHRRGSVKMSVRVIYRTDVFSQANNGSKNFATLINNPVTPPHTHATTSAQTAQTTETAEVTVNSDECQQTGSLENTAESICKMQQQDANNSQKSEGGDSLPKLRLSPKSFRFSSRFGRSKSEMDEYTSEAFNNYSKSFQEYDSVCPVSCAGPQGAVDKPFLLHDGRVGLRASLDKAWYTHDEDICVTINIRNDSKKTVRKIRVCAFQHVDVCMFNNGKFKNVVADSDNLTPPIMDHHVAPGATLNTTVVLRPQRGVTKNWIALEDTLQRSTEPDEIKAHIAASAVRTPHFLMQNYHSPSNCINPPILMPATQTSSSASSTDERNMFAIYVSYYVKVKLTLSGMGGELSLKLPFLLVHIDEEQRRLNKMHKLSLEAVPVNKKYFSKTKIPVKKVQSVHEFAFANNLDRIESVEEGSLSNKPSPLHVKDNNKSQIILKENMEEPLCFKNLGNERRRYFKRSETLAKDLDTEEDETIETENIQNETKEQQNIEAVAKVLNVTSSSFEEEEEDEKDDDIKISFNKKIIRKNSKNLSENIIQPIKENLDTKKVNEISGLNSASPAV